MGIRPGLLVTSSESRPLYSSLNENHIRHFQLSPQSQTSHKEVSSGVYQEQTTAEMQGDEDIAQ